MKVNVSRENENELFLSAYPTFEVYPHIYVLESDGTLLHSQDTSELLVGRTREIEQHLLHFLERWSPTSDESAGSGS